MIEFSKATTSDFPSLKPLLLEAFKEIEDALNLLFQENISFFTTYCAKIDNKICASVYMIPCFLNGYQAHYLCGVSTMKSQRGKGIMSQLIPYALRACAEEGDVYSVLLPASESLYHFYEKFGYLPQCSAGIECFSREELMGKSKALVIETSTYSHKDLQKISYQQDFLLWEDSFLAFAKKYYGTYGVHCIEEKNCFALYEEKGGMVVVLYAIYTDFSALAHHLLNVSTAKHFEIVGKGKEKRGMIKPLKTGVPLPNNVFIGLTLD